MTTGSPVCLILGTTQFSLTFYLLWCNGCHKTEIIQHHLDWTRQKQATREGATWTIQSVQRRLQHTISWKKNQAWCNAASRTELVLTTHCRASSSWSSWKPKEQESVMEGEGFGMSPSKNWAPCLQDQFPSHNLMESSQHSEWERKGESSSSLHSQFFNFCLLYTSPSPRD